MALGERFKSDGARGLARFLADHQNCDAGFDVRREEEPGSGRLRIACLGCGATVSYRAAEAGNFSSAIVDVGAANGSAHGLGPPVGVVEPAEASETAKPAKAPEPADIAAPKRTADLGPASSGPPRRPGSGRGPGRGRAGRKAAPGSKPASPTRAGALARLPRWIPTALIALLIAGGLTMIAIGLLRDDGESSQTASAPPAQPAPSAGAPQPQGEPAPPEPPPASAPARSGDGTGRPAEPAALRRSTYAGRFSIGLPAGWRESGDASRGFTFAPAGAAAAVRVYFEAGERPLGELGDLAATFLADSHAGASISEPEQGRFAGGPAAAVRSRYGGGEEVAFVLARDGFSYLVLRRVDRGASEKLGAEAQAVTAGFRPR